MTTVKRIAPVILVGGGGTRLWPLSRPGTPKQFVNLVGAKSMLGETLGRITPEATDNEAFTFSPPVLVGAARQARALLQEIESAGFTRHLMILEPAPRNTAPAIAAAALSVQRSSPGGLMLVLPADHHIKDVPAFHAAIARGLEAASEGSIVTFGVVPDKPETGYGYISRGGALPGTEGIYSVARFVEKPDAKTAQDYVDSGAHFWNAGIFLVRADRLIDAMQTHARDVLERSREAVDTATYTNAGLALGHNAFLPIRAESIDVAVMEKADNVVVVPVDMGWSDVGSWAALFEVGDGPRDGEVKRGRVIDLNATGTYLRSDQGLVAVIGVDDIAVIRDRDTVLVTPLSRAQDVKTVAERVLDLSPIPIAGTGDGAPIPSDFTAAAGRFSRWLRDEVTPRWLSTAWDEERGGFREQVGLDGEPVIEEARRVRVQARQIFAFSAMHLLGWSDKALDVATRGYNYLTRTAWAPTGGWCHLISPSGSIIDPMRDAYDHAFVAFALAWYHRASGDRSALVWARRTLDYLDAVLIDPDHGGYRESVPNQNTRRANPHMHLLEASLALFDSTQDFTHLDRADAMVELFVDHFFDERTGSVGETFSDQWGSFPGEQGEEREPGHCFEWAWLLGQHRHRLGADLSGHADRLADFAWERGLNPATGLVLDAISRDGGVVRTGHRIWPQTEAIRALAAGCGSDTQAGPERAAQLIDAFFEHHVASATSGLWIDRVDGDGQPVAGVVPASTLYHVMTLGWELAPFADVRPAA